jgi:hypothetical protein
MVVASWFVIAGLAMPVTDKMPVDGLIDSLVDATFAPVIEPVVALVNVR